MYNPVKAIEVRIWGRRVGALALDPSLGYYAHNPQDEWTNQHLMSVNGKFSNITRADLLTLAERFAIGTGEKVLKQVGEAISAWPDFAQKANVSGLESDRIRSHHKIL